MLETIPKNVIECGSSCSQIILTKEDNIVVAVEIINYTYHNEVSSSNVLSKEYALCCQLLADYIDLAGFNRSDKHSIPNYLPY